MSAFLSPVNSALLDITIAAAPNSSLNLTLFAGAFLTIFSFLKFGCHFCFTISLIF